MRAQIDTFEKKFLELNRRTFRLLENTSNDLLYGIRSEDGKTIGENVLRSAGAVEQMIGGITRRLWDDPFEWTLPERMQTVNAIAEYLDEVETSRRSGFLFLKSDDDLSKSLPAPVEMKTLFQVLEDAFVLAESYLVNAETMNASQSD